MIHLIIESFLTLTAAGAFSSFIYLFFHRQSASAAPPAKNLDDHLRRNVLRLQARCGYNPQSLVSLAPSANLWFDFATQSGLSYVEYGKVRLVAGDLLATDENIKNALEKFLEQMRADKKIVAFLPATEKFARLAAHYGFQAIKVGASPYFDLPRWNPRGNSAKKMRAGCNQAKRAGVSVRQVFELSPKFQLEVYNLSQSWKDTRLAKVNFGWLFELNPFLNFELKKYFAARDGAGSLIGLLIASPIPAREGWYLEDFLHAPDSPRGTTDLLIYETLKMLAAEGAKIATLGTVPLDTSGTGELSGSGYFWTKKLLALACRHLNFLYNFNGLRRFKAKFVPDWWESEYVLLPDAFLVAPRVTRAFLHALLPEGISAAAVNQFFKK